MGKVFLGSCRVLPFEGVTPSDNAARLVSVLGLEAVRDRVDGFDAALTVALWHDSYLHEHRNDAPSLTPGVLGALEGLGATWISRELATMVARSRHDDKPGTISATVARSRAALTERIGESEWVIELANVGRSLERSQPSSVRVRVFQQVAGLVALVGAEEALRGHLGAALSAAMANDAPNVDWQGLLQKIATEQRAAVDWSFDMTGPDHDREFVATCSLGNSRTVSAAGRSKKAARIDAAQEMVRRHFPGLQPSPDQDFPPPRPPQSVPRTQHPGFLRTLDAITAAFGLPEHAKPLVSQAFLHPSWTYEQKEEVARSRQRDHGVLGYIGSQVLNYEASLSATYTAVHEAPEEYRLLTLERESEAQAARALDLGRAAVLGRGQRSQGLTLELESTLLQALMAALYLALGSPKSLLDTWPPGDAWETVATLIAPGRSRGHDGTTRVQEFASATALTTSYAVDRAGPDHQSEYTARLTLESQALRRRLKVTGPSRSGKTQAKRAVSDIVARWIDALNDTGSLARIADGEGQDLAGATFLLAHLCEEVSTRPRVEARWYRQKLLGSAFQGAELERWAAAADKVLERQQRVRPDVEGLESYFRQLSGTTERALPLSAALNETLRWVSELDPQAAIDVHEERRLVDLAAAYRALGGDQQQVSLIDVLEGQALLARGLLEADLPADAHPIPALAAAAVESVLAVLIADRRAVRSRLDLPDKLLVDPEPSATPTQLEGTVGVWRSLGINIEVEARSGRAVIPLGLRRNEPTGPIGDAVRRASTPEPSTLAAAIADLLHDLKNQVSAARALTAAPESGSRTAKLERQLAASRHLDQAAALGERIRAATSLLRPSATGETTPLAEFLRRYASTMLVRLPASVSLSIGSAGDEMRVAISEPALTAILDNLIKNAVEAMPDGGHVTLEWAGDEHFAVVEIADDGPGLPQSVADALKTGARIRSTKAGGNGLGILGVRSLLRTAGGDFELARVDSGTTWHLTIPIADEVPP